MHTLQTLMNERQTSFCSLETTVCFTTFLLSPRSLYKKHRGIGGTSTVEKIHWFQMPEFSEYFPLHTLHADMKFTACFRGQTFQRGIHEMMN